MDFYLELYAFGAVPVRKKYEILDSLYFPCHFYFTRGHPSVELTEHDDSAADHVDIFLHSWVGNQCGECEKQQQQPYIYALLHS